MVRFDTAQHDLYEAAILLLQRVGKAVGEFAAEEEEKEAAVRQAEREGEGEGKKSGGEGASRGEDAGVSTGECAGERAEGGDQRAGSISDSSIPLRSLKLERFRCRKGMFRDFKARQVLYQSVGRDEAFLEKYVESN